MKNIKDITISIFAIIGFAFLLSSFTPNGAEETEQQVYGTPESHVWAMHNDGESSQSKTYLYNKRTGDIRRIRGSFKIKDAGYVVLENTTE